MTHAEVRSKTAPDSIKAYTRLGLAAYDAVVVNGFAPRFWGCAAGRLVEHYREHVTFNHADVGVGTGYFLDHCDRPFSRLALIDLQPNCLQHTSRRLARFRPSCHVRDVWQPIVGVEKPAFDSIALGGILHCLAGAFDEKGRVFDNLAALARPGTKIFGYTMVADGVRDRAHSRALHDLLNRLRVIDNTRDRVADLGHALESRFSDCKVSLIGSMALFSAVAPPNYCRGTSHDRHRLHPRNPEL